MSSEPTITEEDWMKKEQAEFAAYIGIDWADKKHELGRSSQPGLQRLLRRAIVSRASRKSDALPRFT